MKRRQCPVCKSTGKIYERLSSDPTTCKNCNGTGIIEIEEPINPITPNEEV
jgi:DnaJ-class molecular chaperone